MIVEVLHHLMIRTQLFIEVAYHLIIHCDLVIDIFQRERRGRPSQIIEIIRHWRSFILRVWR